MPPPADDALRINATVIGPIPVGSNFNIADATSGTGGCAVASTSNTTRHAFPAAPTTNILVQITTTRIPLAIVVAAVGKPGDPDHRPAIDGLPLTPAILMWAVRLLIAGGNRWSFQGGLDYQFNHTCNAGQVRTTFALALCVQDASPGFTATACSSRKYISLLSSGKGKCVGELTLGRCS